MQIANDSTWVMSVGGPTIHPARHPGMACDFDRLLMVTTWSGRLADRLGTRTPGDRPAYTSSTTTQSPCRRADSPITARSDSLRMTPLGLLGVAKNNARVLE